MRSGRGGRPVVRGGAGCKCPSVLRPDRVVPTPAAGGPHLGITRSSNWLGVGRPAAAWHPCRARDGLQASPAQRSRALALDSRLRLSAGGNWRSEGEGGHGPAHRRPRGKGMRFALSPEMRVTGLWRARDVTLARTCGACRRALGSKAGTPTGPRNSGSATACHFPLTH